MRINNKKWKLSIAATLGFTAMIILFDLIPRYSMLFGQVFDYMGRKSEAGSFAQNEQELKMLKSENQNLQTSINSVVADYKENKNLSSILAYIDENAAESGIRIKEIKPGELKRQDNLWLQPIELNLTSRYENIFNYMRFLERSNKVILVNELTLKPITFINDSLNIKASLEVYLNL